MKLPLGALLVLGAATGGGLHLLERDHPLVEQGLDAYNAGEYEKALGAFDAARARLPEDATVELNRGNALYRLDRMDEAAQAYQRATELDARSGQLQARDEYNLGTTLAQMGKKKEALRALRQSLVKNPGDEDARHNLEVLLRDLQKQKQPPSPGDAGQDAGPDAGNNDGGRPDASQDAGPESDAGEDGGPGDGGADGGSDAGADGGADGGQGGQHEGKDGGQSDAGQPDAGTGEGQNDAGPQDAGQGQDAQPPKLQDYDQQDGGAGKSGEPLDKQETERMLDAIRQNERNLQLWRFQQKKRKNRDPDKDW